ncbi:MAG: hypothetical protein IIB44_10225, partial [Candidatus Marinimicrobia bacterium]|nr:hypothetical protein [Candidatus Neomarinimicrobiota bacterium]
MIFNNMESKKGMESINCVDGALTQSMQSKGKRNMEFVNRVDGALTQSMQSKGKRNMQSKVKGLLFTIILQFGFAATINIPADYSTIQAGIDASTNGDTVLVQPGTYVENINFNGKNIVVGSLTLTTGDTSNISQTIIDGNQDGSVVTFNNSEDMSAVLYGFTIRNGKAKDRAGGGVDWRGGGGIFLDNASPRLIWLIIEDNSTTGTNYTEPARAGGGLYIEGGNILILNSTIRNNTASECAGLYAGNCTLTIRNSTISNNQSGNPSGMWAGNSMVNLFNVVISHNNGGVAYYNTHGSFSTFENVTITDNSQGVNCSNGGATLNVMNSIIRNDGSFEISLVGGPSTVNIAYTNIRGGQTGIDNQDNSSVNWLSGNIDLYPQFVDSANGDYHLTDTSPCISRGADSVQIAGTWYYFPCGDFHVEIATDNFYHSMGWIESALAISEESPDAVFVIIQATLRYALFSDETLSTTLYSLIWSNFFNSQLLAAKINAEDLSEDTKQVFQRLIERHRTSVDESNIRATEDGRQLNDWDA